MSIDVNAVLVSVGVITTGVATITGNIVIIFQQRGLHKKTDTLDKKSDNLTQTVNGRMDQLLHVTAKNAALEAIEPSDSETIHPTDERGT